MRAHPVWLNHAVSSQGMSRGDTSVDPNTIAALQQAQLFALQSQACRRSHMAWRNLPPGTTCWNMSIKKYVEEILQQLANIGNII
jgi:hypothetical protein